MGMSAGRGNWDSCQLFPPTILGLRILGHSLPYYALLEARACPATTSALTRAAENLDFRFKSNTPHNAACTASSTGHFGTLAFGVLEMNVMAIQREDGEKIYTYKHMSAEYNAALVPPNSR